MLSLEMASAKGLLKGEYLGRMLWELGNVFHCCRKVKAGTEPVSYGKLCHDDVEGGPSPSQLQIPPWWQEHGKDTREHHQHKPGLPGQEEACQKKENALAYQLTVIKTARKGMFVL